MGRKIFSDYQNGYNDAFKGVFNPPKKREEYIRGVKDAKMDLRNFYYFCKIQSKF